MTQTLLKESETRTPVPPPSTRRRIRLAALVAAAVLVLAIAAAVATSRSGEVSEPVERPAEEVHPADRHLLNQAARIQAQRRSTRGDTVAPATGAVLSDEHLERGERLRAAQRELAALRAAVRDVPSIADSMRGRMTLLSLVISRQVPVESLDPADPAPEGDGSDRHLLNQAAMYQARRASSQGSDVLSQAKLHQMRRASSQGSDVLSQAKLHQMRRASSQGSDRRLRNQTRKLE